VLSAKWIKPRRSHRRAAVEPWEFARADRRPHPRRTSSRVQSCTSPPEVRTGSLTAAILSSSTRARATLPSPRTAIAPVGIPVRNDDRVESAERVRSRPSDRPFAVMPGPEPALIARRGVTGRSPSQPLAHRWKRKRSVSTREDRTKRWLRAGPTGVATDPPPRRWTARSSQRPCSTVTRGVLILTDQRTRLERIIEAIRHRRGHGSRRAGSTIIQDLPVWDSDQSPSVSPRLRARFAPRLARKPCVGKRREPRACTSRASICRGQGWSLRRPLPREPPSPVLALLAGERLPSGDDRFAKPRGCRVAPFRHRVGRGLAAWASRTPTRGAGRENPFWPIFDEVPPRRRPGR